MGDSLKFKCFNLLNRVNILSVLLLSPWFGYATFQVECRNKGGYLAEINSETENIFIKEQATIIGGNSLQFCLIFVFAHEHRKSSELALLRKHFM